MKNKNYTFFKSREWEFEVKSDFSLVNHTSYCTCKGDSSINAICTINNDIVKVRFPTASTNVKKGLYKYDVEVYNSGINTTIQKGEILVI